MPPECDAATPRILPGKRLGDGAFPAAALPGCVARSASAAPLAIATERCNRCGACLGLGCGAITDAGGEALVIDPALCTGGGLCAPGCRSRAIGRARR